MTKYYKFINKFNDRINNDETTILKNRDYVYKIGLNIVNNFNSSSKCTANALYFTDKKNIYINALNMVIVYSELAVLKIRK